MLHCPHCLNNWPCLEPLEACVRRNIYIRSRRGSYRSRPKTSVRRETTSEHMSKLLEQETIQTYLDTQGDQLTIKPWCFCTEDQKRAGHSAWCSRKEFVRLANKERKRLSDVVSGPALGKPRRPPQGDGDQRRRSSSTGAVQRTIARPIATVGSVAVGEQQSNPWF